MSWSVFWIDPAQLSPQIGLSTSAVLTLIAFQFSLAYMLPRLSYLTRADRFVLGAAFLVFAALAEAVATSYLARRKKEQLANWIDRTARWVFPLGYLSVLLVSFQL